MTNKDLIEKDRPIATHIDLENGPPCRIAEVGRSTRKSFMDHGLGPNYPGRFPSSRDWNMPTIKCGRKTCAANYKGNCVMPSLIEIGANGMCKGYHKRKSGKKK